MNEAERIALRNRLNAYDYTIRNVNIQEAIERVFARWIETYRSGDKKSIFENIPDKIRLGETDYTPEQVFENVKSRTPLGLEIMQTVHEIRSRSQLWIGNAQLREHALHSTSIFSAEGRIFTYRDLLSEFLSGRPDNIFLKVGLEDTVASLYDASREAIFEKCGMLTKL